MTEAKSSTPVAEPAVFTGKRRSKRIYIAIPVVVRLRNGNLTLEESTRTVRLNAHGCLVHLLAQLERGQTVSLLNSATAEEMICTVNFVGKGDGDKIEFGLEFTEPAPLFWRIHFPPEDWNPEDRKLPTAPSAPPSDSSPRR